MNEASGEVGRLYTQVRNVPQNMGIAIEIVTITVCVAKLLVLSVWGYVLCFYFRFVPDAVLRSRTMSIPVEVDRACQKTASNPLASRFIQTPTYNYFRFPSAILNLQML